MKICVLNGSPKGQESITMQYVRFLALAYPSHTFVVEEIGGRIAAIEAGLSVFSRVTASVAAADAVLFATPVYYMLVPAQFKRFFELVSIRNAVSAFEGKYAASLTTSIHFFDNTANDYLHAIAEDFGMHWAGAYMAKTEDLLDERNQENLLLFADDFLDTAGRRPPVQRTYPPLPGERPVYRPGPVPVPFDARGKNVIILTDAAPGSNLEKMVGRAASCFGRAASIVPLEEAGIRGGCLGCCRCAFDNTCVYSDTFPAFFKETIRPADILVIAGSIRDRYLSSQFKQFFDRSFCFGHVPYLKGKQVGFLIEGPLSLCSTLREVLTAYTGIQGANPVGFVTDESPSSPAIDAGIDALCDHALRLSGIGYVAPGGFPAVAGHKLLRDEIWQGMRAVFREDHAYYRRYGLYDFPQADYPRRIRTAFLSLLLSLPAVRKKVQAEMNQHMIRPFARVFTDSPVLKRRQKNA